MMNLEPIGWVKGGRQAAEDDFWGGTEVAIELAEGFDAEALHGLEGFSHVEVIFVFHRVDESKIVTGARHPRNNPEWPAIGIFAQRGRNRPNRLGSTLCEVVRREGRQLIVRELDAIAGTPVVDLKPVMREFLPRTEVRQPQWVEGLMRDYWINSSEG